jgi:hypothetical protein
MSMIESSRERRRSLWPVSRRSLGRIVASPDKPQANRITIPICKESPSKTAISGKTDYFATPLPDSKSRTWEFFTGD